MYAADGPGSRAGNRQLAALEKLISISREVPDAPTEGPRYRRGRLSSGDSRNLAGGPFPLAEGQATPGALSLWYDVPTVRYVSSWNPLWTLITASAIIILVLRFSLFSGEPTILVPVWIIGFSMRVLPLIISWFDKPFTTTPRQDRYLETLYVVVAVPVYNEDPMLLDRCLWALANQSRPPDVVHVVEDGPSADYEALRSHWTGRSPGSARVEWTQMPENGGKKIAQSVVFANHGEADIFVTVDSDTTLEHRAIEEGLKPFADARIASVAGVEENFNKRVNWLTRSVAVRNTYYQLTTWAAQSVFRDLLVNRGTYALYRAENIREIIPSYVNETFMGRRIKLGDDAALTLFSRGRGRTVQQISAFSLPMHPEKLSHHFRQWIRWSRGAVIRNCWRLKYLPVFSYGFWWTMLVWYMIFMSGAVPVVLFMTWPVSAKVDEFALAAIILWTYLVGVRTLSVRRSGESTLFRIESLLLYPIGILWATFVLRPLRLYGVVTFLKQRWTTRQAGIESLAIPERTVAGEVMMREVNV